MDTSIDENAKEYNIKKILSYNNNKCIVQWEDNSTSELSNTDINSYSLKVYFEINSFNLNINTLVSGKLACIYMRTSNLNNETSIENQKHNCMNYLKEKNIKIEYIASDIGVSGRNMGNLKKELGIFSNYLNENNILVMNSVDRLGRHCSKAMTFLDSLADRNIDVYFVNENITYNNNINSCDKMTIQNILTQSEYFSNLSSEKTKKIFKLRKQKGNYMGSVAPYGYKIHKINKIRKLSINKIEQNIIKNIITMYKEKLSENTKKKIIYDNIVLELKQKNIKKRNKFFTICSIKNIINNKIKDIEIEEINNLEFDLNHFSF